MRREQFDVTLGTWLVKTQENFEAAGAGLITCSDDVQATLLQITPEIVVITPSPGRNFAEPDKAIEDVRTLHRRCGSF